MFLKILGWFWIITGIFFLLKPEQFRARMQKKSVKKLKKFFFGLAVGLGCLLIGATWGVPGVLAKIVMIFGLIGILKGFYFLKGKTADKLIKWYVNQPVSFFRISAVVQIVIGAIILSV